MSLDAKPVRLVSTGVVELSADGVCLRGFEGEGTSCRDVVALAIVWAIGELQRELAATLREPGGGRVAVD